MTYLDFLDLLGSRLIEKHNSMQNLDCHEIHIEMPITFLHSFSLITKQNFKKNIIIQVNSADS